MTAVDTNVHIRFLTRDELEGWIRRHIRKCFWLRWHNAQGRRAALDRLGVGGRRLGIFASR